jgi:hypothetical protein
MRRTAVALAVVCTAGVAGCGSTQHFADEARPATPVDLTVYINNARVSVSPTSVGAGPVVFYITNQASSAQSLTIRSASKTVASIQPINPGSTAQVQVNFASGAYQVATGSQIHPATLKIGKPRASSDNVLLQP